MYEIDEAEGQTFLAMAYLEGRTVKDKIAERPLKLDRALDIAVQTAQGLQAAHEKDIVHRDIKSANLMVTPQGQVKIMDFGLAQLAERSKLTETTTILGTPSYMSPEQAEGDGAEGDRPKEAEGRPKGRPKGTVTVTRTLPWAASAFRGREGLWSLVLERPDQRPQSDWTVGAYRCAQPFQCASGPCVPHLRALLGARLG